MPCYFFLFGETKKRAMLKQACQEAIVNGAMHASAIHGGLVREKGHYCKRGYQNNPTLTQSKDPEIKV